MRQSKLRLASGAALVGIVIVCAAWGLNAIQAHALAEKQWADLRARGALRVAIDPGSQPFSFYDATGWQGLDADLTREIARRMGLQIQIDPVGYDTLYDALHVWHDDIVVSALVVDPSRAAEYTYTQSYFDAGLRLVTPVTSTVRSINDLANKRVSVALGSDADRAARYWQRRLSNVTRLTVADDDVAIRQVQSGTSDAAIVEALAAEKLTSTSAVMTSISIAPQPYAIALRRDNPILLDEINRVLNSMRADGTLDRLVSRWTKQ